jgi:integrase
MSYHLRKRKTKTGYNWQAIIEQEPDPNTGHRNRIYKTFPDCTRAEAEKIVRKMLTEIDNGIFVKDDKITVEEYLRNWLDLYIKNHKSPSTAESYIYHVENYILPKFGKVKMQDLSTINIQKWFNDMAKKSPLSNKPLHPKTIRNIYMNFNAALKKAVILEILTKNPAEHIELPRCKKYVAEVLNSEELSKLIEAVKGSELEVGVMILVCLGLRRGELLGLTFDDIDFDTNMVNIKNNVVQLKGRTITKDPKTQSGLREIEAPDVLMELLRKEKDSYMQRKLEYGKSFTDSRLVITQADGSPLRPDWYSEKFKRFLKAKGLKRIRLHDLRHSNATFMLKLGVNVKAMQKRLGHSTFSTTMDIYSHAIEEITQEANKKLEAGLKDIMK